ncbi:hypothetical protein [Streptomyces sp. NPDC048845]|uniref:hypothetical protein n=1 Tax=Streptomyces sp. NPDC048845 TaxID=3155390 RepID=UPI00341BE813
MAGLLGGPDAVAELLPLVDPLRLPPPAVPVTLLHGTDDPDVPPTLSRAYAEAARRAGGDVTLWEQPGTGHFAALTPARVATGPYADLLAALRGAPRPA